VGQQGMQSQAQNLAWGAKGDQGYWVGKATGWARLLWVGKAQTLHARRERAGEYTNSQRQ